MLYQYWCLYYNRLVWARPLYEHEPGALHFAPNDGDFKCTTLHSIPFSGIESADKLYHQTPKE